MCVVTEGPDATHTTIYCLIFGVHQVQLQRLFWCSVFWTSLQNPCPPPCITLSIHLLFEALQSQVFCGSFVCAASALQPCSSCYLLLAVIHVPIFFFFFFKLWVWAYFSLNVLFSFCPLQQIWEILAVKMNLDLGLNFPRTSKTKGFFH